MDGGPDDMATNDDDERTQFNFGLRADTKKNWEQYVEQSRNHATLAAFIRYAVNQEIDSDEPTSSGAGVSEDVSDRLAKLADRQRQIQDEIAGLIDDIETVKNQTSEPSDDLQDLANDVFGALPTRDEATWRYDTEGMPGGSDNYQGPDTGRVADLAEHIDAPRYRVRDALDHLQKSSSMVRTTVEDDEMRFYRRM